MRLSHPLIFVVCTIAACAGAATATEGRPNVLFIVVDDLRPSLGCYGDAVAVTPNIDVLAKRGTLFTRAYCQQAVCNPSRQSLLTSRRPDTIRVWDLKNHFRRTSPDVVTLPEYFKNHGYFAQGLGKIFHDGSPMADPRSWSVPEQFEDVRKIDDYRLPENRLDGKNQKATSTEFVQASEEDYPDGRVATAAVAALEKLAAEPGRLPFFLAVGFRKPHLPFTAPNKYWQLYDASRIPTVARPQPPLGAPEIALHNSVELRGYSDIPDVGALSSADTVRLRHGYYAAASFTDAQVGRVIAALDRTGLANDTIIVLFADHGFHLGEHGLWAKTTNYEADTRVPLVIVRPQSTSSQQKPATSAALVELLDLYPTLVDLCGLPPAADLEGRSLRPWLEQPDLASRTAAFSQFPRPRMDDQPQIMGYAVRTATHRYVEWRRFGTREIVARELYAYDGETLLESENLADDPRQSGLLEKMSMASAAATARLAIVGAGG